MIARALLAVVVLAVACSPEREPGGTTRAAISHGTPTTTDPAVVGIVYGGAILCTGTLVHPRVVLTAAHCVREDLSVFIGNDVRESGVIISSADARPHPDYDPATLANDVALVLLRERAPAEVPIPPMNERPLGPEAIGEPVRIVGFGWNHDAATPFGVKNTGTAKLRAYTQSTLDLDPDPAATCGGDSGGPAFANVDGVETLVGVTSAGQESCEGLSRFSRVDAYLSSFVRPYLANVAEATKGVGERCFYDAHCRGGVCLSPDDAPTFPYCADPCSSGADCPAPMICKSSTASGSSQCRYPLPSPGALGAACEDDADCATKVCARQGEDRAVCSIRCVEDLISCPRQFVCRSIGDGRSACFSAAESIYGGGCGMSRRRHSAFSFALLGSALLVMGSRKRSSKR